MRGSYVELRRAEAGQRTAAPRRNAAKADGDYFVPSARPPSAPGEAKPGAQSVEESPF